MWKYIEKYDIVGLSETWMDEKAWNRMRGRQALTHEWSSVPAVKEKRKGRAKGGLVAAVSRELGAVKVRTVNEGAIEIKVRINNKNWRIVVVYSSNMGETLGYLECEIEEEEEDLLLLGGDFNARAANEGGPIGGGEWKEEAKRRSKDRVINKDGRALLTGIKERGWSILNGSYEDEGNWTYIGENGASVIDYVIANEAAREEVKKVIEGNKTESDHMPLEVELEGNGRKRRGGVEMGETVEGERSIWSEEGVKHYQEKCEGSYSKQTMTEDIWKEMVEKVKESVMKCRTKRKAWKIGRRIWHSVEWKRYEKEEEDKIKSIRTEKEVWKYINKYRKKKEGIDESIQSERWRRHFMDLLDGASEKMILEEREETEEGEEKGTTSGRGEEEIMKEELIAQLEWRRGLDRGTPNYIVVEETKMKEFRIEAIKRVVRYEEKARRSNKKLVVECCRELDRGVQRGEESKWEKKRRTVLEKAAMGQDEIRKRKEIVAEGVPLYLQGKRKRAERRLIARFRCENEARGNQYQRDMEDRICRVCEKNIEYMDHIVRECVGTKEGWAVEELLKEDGSGWEAMRRIVGIREAEIEGSRAERGKGKGKQSTNLGKVAIM
ncbi:hypothetical protein KM043_016066 [Ampulex compressa]|nr:hypothetical protein KM043_016066 [Ampulex compressa]